MDGRPERPEERDTVDMAGLSAQRAPLAGYQHQNQPRSSDAAGDWGEQIEYGHVLNHHEEMIKSEGEATKALRRLKQRRSSAASKGKGKAVDMGGVERDMEGLNVR